MLSALGYACSFRDLLPQLQELHDTLNLPLMRSVPDSLGHGSSRSANYECSFPVFNMNFPHIISSAHDMLGAVRPCGKPCSPCCCLYFRFCLVTQACLTASCMPATCLKRACRYVVGEQYIASCLQLLSCLSLHLHPRCRSTGGAHVTRAMMQYGGVDSVVGKHSHCQDVVV